MDFHPLPSMEAVLCTSEWAAESNRVRVDVDNVNDSLLSRLLQECFLAHYSQYHRLSIPDGSDAHWGTPWKHGDDIANTWLTCEPEQQKPCA